MHVRIKFELVDDTGMVVLERSHYSDFKQLKQARFPYLPDTASEEAEKFWQSVVMMGYTENGNRD